MRKTAAVATVASVLAAVAATGRAKLPAGESGAGQTTPACSAPPAAAAPTAALPPRLVERTRFLRARVEADPADFVARGLLVGALLDAARETGRLELVGQARREAAASLDAVPAEANPAGLALLARCELELHKSGAALASAERALAIDPGERTALAVAADVHIERGEAVRAEAFLARLAAFGETPAVLARRSSLAELRGDLVEALALLAGAGDDPSVPLRRSALALRLGDPGRAQAELDAAAESFARRLGLAELRAVAGRYDEALSLLRRAAEETGRPDAFEAVAGLYAHAGNRDCAERWYRRAEAGYLASAARGEGLFVHHLASLYADALPDPAEAVRWAELDAERRPGPQSWAALGWALYRHGRFEEAAQPIGKALERSRGDAHLLQHAGLVYWRAGRLDEARALLDRVAAADALSGRFHLHR